MASDTPNENGPCGKYAPNELFRKITGVVNAEEGSSFDLVSKIHKDVANEENSITNIIRFAFDTAAQVLASQIDPRKMIDLAVKHLVETERWTPEEATQYVSIVTKTYQDNPKKKGPVELNPEDVISYCRTDSNEQL